jgi:hypothetical protein
MPPKKIFGQSRDMNPPNSENGQLPARRSDLVEIVLEPLANQIDSVMLEMIQKLEELNESVEIIARQIGREIGSK